MSKNEDVVIAVVDDDRDAREFLSSVLSEMGTVVPFASGEELLAWLRGGIRTDLITLDLEMPMENGDEVLKKLKGDPCWQGIPVVMITANGNDQGVGKKLIELGAVAVVTKPFELEQLRTTIRKALV